MVEPNEPLFPANCSVCGKEVMCEQEVIDYGIIMCSETCMLMVFAVDDAAEGDEPTDEELADLREHTLADLEAIQLMLLNFQEKARRQDGWVDVPEKAWDFICNLAQQFLAELKNKHYPDADD